MLARSFSQDFVLPFRSRNSRRRRLPHERNPANQRLQRVSLASKPAELLPILKISVFVKFYLTFTMSLSQYHEKSEKRLAF